MSGALEVWLDVDFLEERHKVGTLSHDRGQVRFSYGLVTILIQIISRHETY